MPLLAQEHLPIPTKDILSWCYDNRSAYDQDKPIYIDAANPSDYITANQAYKLIRRLVAGFRAAGIGKGDCVCIHSFNKLYYPILVQGIIGAGGTFVGTNPAYTAFELNHAFKVSKAKMVIVEPDLVGAVRKPAAEQGIAPDRILFLAPESGECKSWKSLLEHGEQDWVAFDDLETSKNTNAFYMFSSGTTGLPKAAQLSHYNIIAQHTLVHEHPAHPELYTVRRLVTMPFFHVATAPFTHTTTLRSGKQSFIMRRFELHSALANLEQFKITSLMIVPPMVVAMINHARTNREQVKRQLSSLRAIVAGAAPLDKDTQSELQKLLPPDSVFTQLWAMTETTCVAMYFYFPDSDTTGSTGRFIPNIDAKLVDDNGSEVGPYDVRGELCVRGPTVIRGYLNNPEANSRDWDAEGYFHTGDIVYCDSKTKLWYVVDRKKELIKVRGFQVAPSELEGVLLAHSDIHDAAVIGVDAGEAGELPRAYVVRREGSGLSEQDVSAWLNERLAKFKRLDGGVKFVESIPKTASGKILKRVLREEAKKEMGAKL